MVVPEGVQPEFSRVVSVPDLPRTGLDFQIEPNAAERAALCRRIDVLALNMLRAQVHVERRADGSGAEIVRVEGSLVAKVVQSCVVTLEPFEALIENSFTADFAPNALSDPLPEASDVSAADLPEPLPGDEIDVGELVSEHLALSLDPYPRRPGAPTMDVEFPPPAAAPDNGAGPFAALGQLKVKM